jgi:hypothetical protein
MTRITPLRRITLQFSQIGFTDERTFMPNSCLLSLLVAVDDPPAGQVVRRQLDGDLVPGEDL